jgi:chromosome partitioning protein
VATTSNSRHRLKLTMPTAISDAGITKQTLYEVPREDFSKGTYDRAMDSLNNVNAEIEELIKSAWGRV